MKFALPLILLFFITLPVDATGQGRFVSEKSSIKTIQQTSQKLKVKSSKQAAKIAKARFGGKVLKVNKKKSGYRVKLIKTDGHIVSVYVNSKTGKVNGG